MMMAVRGSYDECASGKKIAQLLRLKIANLIVLTTVYKYAYLSLYLCCC